MENNDLKELISQYKEKIEEIIGLLDTLTMINKTNENIKKDEDVLVLNKALNELNNIKNKDNKTLLDDYNESNKQRSFLSNVEYKKMIDNIILGLPQFQPIDNDEKRKIALNYANKIYEAQVNSLNKKLEYHLYDLLSNYFMGITYHDIITLRDNLNRLLVLGD